MGGWLLVIAVMSGDVASRSGTESSLLQLLSALWPALTTALQDAAWWEAAGWAVRKAAHLTEYGVLALLTLRALRGDAGLWGAGRPAGGSPPGGGAESGGGAGPRRASDPLGGADPARGANSRRDAALMAGFVFLFCGFVASVDEFHQAGVASRSGSAVDVGIDLVGAFLALAGATLMQWLRGRK